MKRTFTLLLMLTITTFIVTLGCDTGSSGDADDDSNNTIQFTEGWWRYQTDIAGTQVTYILYDSNKTVIRAGTESVEYSSEYLVGHVQALSFDLLVNTVSTSSTFSLVPDDSLPDWVTTSEDPIYFIEGWWFFEDVRYDPLRVYTYVLFDSDQTVLRAGSESYEYYPNYVENNVDDFSFDHFVSLALDSPLVIFYRSSFCPECTQEEDGTLQFKQGWWKYQIYGSDYSVESYYVQYDSNQTVLRAGSWSQEFNTPDDSFYSWYVIASSVCTRRVFTPVSDDSLPDWAV